MDRVSPGLVALLVAAPMVVLLFIPFVAISYRRKGGLTPWRTVGWIGMLVYLVGLLAYVLLPFPQPGGFECAAANLRPFAFIGDIARERASDVPLLTSPALQQFALNVLLFVPLGVFLRSLFRRGVAIAAVIGFGVSLLVESTQLTGIWGLYECAYRVFDVDDLMANTLGAVLGSVLWWPVGHPRTASRVDVDAPRPVTVARRLTGIFVDWLGVTLLGIGVAATVQIGGFVLTGHHSGWVAAAGDLLFWAVPLLLQWALVVFGGATLGERCVLLAEVDGRWPPFAARTLRVFAGIGGYLVLPLIPVVGGVLQAVLIVVTVVGAWMTDGHRGFALAVSWMHIIDRRDGVGALNARRVRESPDSTE